MPGHLADYGRKRNFDKTPEPKGTRKGKGKNIFVIHKHHARRLHWDLRLQVGDVLASWAVPKRPSLDPKVKRLAVHVEDHPLEYATFKGTIPQEQYGAGLVEIWDKGTWKTEGDAREQIAKGKLDFELFGDKLHGRFVLVRMHGDEDKNWLLMKVDDDEAVHEQRVKGAKSTAMPSRIKLQLCKKQDEPPSGQGWVHEVKWDGYRVLAYVKDKEVTLVSRGGKTLDIPSLVTALDGLPDCILDGEVVAIDPEGRSSFPLVHAAIAGGKTSGLVYFVFDVPYAEGQDLRAAPLLERKKVCKRLVARVGLDTVRYSEHSEAPSKQLFETACKSGLEGIVSKRADGKYGAGRTGAWVKCRCVNHLDGWIGGFTEHSATKNAVGAVALGVHDTKGRLVYAGKVGTGFSEKMRRDLYVALQPLKTKHRPFEIVPDGADTKGLTWVEPEIEAEVKFVEWSPGGVMRQPALVGISMNAKSPVAEGKFEITHPERVVDPSSGATKQDVAEYYATVADRLLSNAADRPLAIIRCPDGIESECFFQKHYMQGLHKSVKRVNVGEKTDYMYVDSPEGVLALVQFGMTEMHCWGSSVKNIESPDVVVFDLDPGPDVTWRQVVDASFEVRDYLEDFGLACWARVTGGKGVHVVSPIKPELDWDTFKDFCKQVAVAIEQSDPKRYVSNMAKAKRGGKIFIDYLRNGRGATAIASYSLRARPGMPVAIPVTWDELKRLKAPNQFTLRAAARILKKDDPWKGFARSRRSLKRLLP